MIGQKNPPYTPSHKLSSDSSLQSLKTSTQSRLRNLKMLSSLGKATKLCNHNKNTKIIEDQNSFHSNHIKEVLKTKARPQIQLNTK